MRVRNIEWKKNLIDLETEKIYEIMKNEYFGLAYAEIKESKLHRHLRTTEVYIVDKGEGILIYGEQKIPLSEGDVVEIKTNIPHKVISENWIKVYVISSPPWSENDHEILEE